LVLPTEVTGPDAPKFSNHAENRRFWQGFYSDKRTQAEIDKEEKGVNNMMSLVFTFALTEFVVFKLFSGAAKGVALESSVSKVMGSSYKAMGEVTAEIKNAELLNVLNTTSKGKWVKVYEAGVQNETKLEVHYFRNNTTKQVFDVKTKYNYWHQKAFKKISE
jgi:hypothetical protein